MTFMRLGFVRWISDAPSGGNLYDEELTSGLRALGCPVVIRRVDRIESAADDTGRAQLTAALHAEPASLVDGIVAGGAPDLIAEAVASGRSVTIVVHHFAADDPELDASGRARLAAAEAATLREASGVLCTSRWAAGELDRRYGLRGVGVAPPGVGPAELAEGRRTTGTPTLLSLGSLTPTKDQLTLVAALQRLIDLPWTAALVGSDTVHPAYAAQVREAVAGAGLSARVRVPGAAFGAALDAEWQAADLLVHTSRAETYGIVVLEALARGVPAVVTAGTGAAEALAAGASAASTAGLTVAPGDPDALTGVLRRWLSDPDLAARWRAAAIASRPLLPTWSSTARAAWAYLRRVTPR